MTKSEIVKEISARTGIDGKAVLAVFLPVRKSGNCQIAETLPDRNGTGAGRDD